MVDVKKIEKKLMNIGFPTRDSEEILGRMVFYEKNNYGRYKMVNATIVFTPTIKEIVYGRNKAEAKQKAKAEIKRQYKTGFWGTKCQKIEEKYRHFDGKSEW